MARAAHEQKEGYSQASIRAISLRRSRSLQNPQSFALRVVFRLAQV